MIVICPSCVKRYMLDDNLLPKEGRQVRCIACHHVWKQIPELSPVANNLPLKGMLDITVDANFSSETRSGRWGWITIFAIFLAFICFVSFGRDFVVKFWPSSERFYELVGLHVTRPGAGLSIASATSLMHQDGPIEMVQIAGDVINTSERIRPIPPLKIKLMGDSPHPKCLDKSEGKCVLDYWEHRLSESSLLPGEQIHFETEPRPKVEGTKHIAVEF